MLHKIFPQTLRGMEEIKNYINGELLPAVSGRRLDNFAPATGEVYSHLPDSGEQEVAVAIVAAQTAFPQWSSLAAEERSRYLFRLADLIEQRAEELALAESIDTGKPVALARAVDIPRAVSNFRFFAAAATQFASESHATGKQAINYTLRQPVGLAGCISPWNLPLYLFTWKIAPALAAGNCVVGKPSELAPMTAYRLAEICRAAELPPGVLNIIHGTGERAGAALVAAPQIPAISFTGGTKTGAAIAAVAAPRFKKLSLELGGKNPVLVFADCDYPAMLRTTLRSSFSNQGEICLCGSRLLVEASLYEKFKKDFVAAAAALKVGDPLLAETQLGAVISRQHLEKILSYVDLAQREGGRVLCGGHPVKVAGRCAHGWFMTPTVIADLPPACRTNQEEIFGPVVSLAPFESEEEALQLANNVPYGLAAIVWTENLTRAHRLAHGLQAGMVWINCWMLRDLRTPFGGMKNSGVGREGGWEALRFFTEPKNICVKLRESPQSGSLPNHD